MSVSTVSSIQPSVSPDTLVPRLPSENAATAISSDGTQGSHLHMFADGDDSPSFWDLLDVINPLQHIPIINDLYREATGDKIGVAARLAGGTLLGGPIGLISSAINCILEESTGKDIGGHVLAMFRDDTDGPPTALASAAAPNSAAEPLPTTEPALAEKIEDKSAAKTAEAAKADAKPLLLADLLGGAEPAAPPPPIAAPIAPVVAEAAQTMAAVPAAGSSPQALAAAADSQPRSLRGRDGRMMPMPTRAPTPIATRSPPAVGMTTSGTSARSNLPVTGQRPTSPPVNLVSAQADAMQQMAATPASTGGLSPASGGNDWFTAAMAQGLQKYERTSKLGQPSGQIIAEP
ncbi:conserved hypothetical protein [Candidatus Terasakiella magnetica]|nr:conserved hypothetical protein [Candidatus Terasakiella magnetica]